MRKYFNGDDGEGQSLNTSENRRLVRVGSVEVQGSVAPELESRKHFASRASREAALKWKGLVEPESGANNRTI